MTAVHFPSRRRGRDARTFHGAMTLFIIVCGCFISSASAAAGPASRWALGRIVGAVWDPRTTRLHLVGDGDAAAARVSTQDVAVALRWAIGRADTPGYVSIDPDDNKPEASFMNVKVSPSALNTSFGWTMFEADRVMKSMGLGFDSIARERLTPSIPGFQNVIEIGRAAGKQTPGVWSRFWLLPGSHREEADGQALRILDARVAVDTEIMQLRGGKLVSTGGLRDPVSEQFARFFTAHYREIAREEPIFDRLEQLLRLLIVAEWARGRALPVDWAWVEGEASPMFAMPAQTPSLRVEATSTTSTSNGIITQQAQVLGGVSFEDLALAATTKDLRSMRTAILGAASVDGSVKTGRFDGQTFSVASFPPAQPVTVRVLAEVPVGPGILRLYGRSPKVSELDLYDPTDTVLAMPRLLGANPNRAERISGSKAKMGGWKRAQQFQGIQGAAESNVPIRRYQLTGADGGALGDFSRHEIDQLQRRIVVKPADVASRWCVAPFGKQFARAFETPDHLYTFEPDDGLLLAEQFGPELVRYWYNGLGVLERITTGGEDGSRTTLWVAELGGNGHRLLRLRRAGTNAVIELTARRQAVRRNLAVTLPYAPSSEGLVLDEATGNWSEQKDASVNYFLGLYGHRVAKLAATPTTEPGVIEAGARTLVLSPDRKQIYVLDASSEDRSRLLTMMHKALPRDWFSTKPGPLGPTIDRELPLKEERDQLERIRRALLETSFNCSSTWLDAG